MRERFYWFKRWSHMEFVNSVVVEVPPRSTVRCLPSATVSTTVLWIFSAFSLSFGWRNICDGILDLSFTKWKNESKRFILGITFPVDHASNHGQLQLEQHHPLQYYNCIKNIKRFEGILCMLFVSPFW